LKATTPMWLFRKMIARYQILLESPLCFARGLPPTNLRSRVGEGRHFLMEGHRKASLLINMCGLREGEKVLDVGCGCGQVAISLGRMLGWDSIDYEGFDIHVPSVLWCQRNIERKHPNFRFRYASVHNSMYGFDNELSASSYRFPFSDASLDLVFLFSIFTHLLPDEAWHYISEIRRVLRPGGRLLATFFFYNESNAVTIGWRRNEPLHQMDGFWTTNPKTPEAAVCFQERDVLQRLDEAGFESSIYHSKLRSNPLPVPLGQEIVIATKRVAKNSSKPTFK
jgi:SAM-dependent methyltransferase